MPFKKKQDYNSYMRDYMQQLRQRERQLIQQARKQLGMSTKIRTRPKRSKR